jgi:hypothetical protein
MTVLNVRYVTFQNLKKKNMRSHRRAADQRGTAGAAARVHRVVADTWAGDSKRAAGAGFESFIAVNGRARWLALQAVDRARGPGLIMGFS